jgi:hypothetical protein
VLSVYCKSAGKAGTHGLVPQASNIGAVSNIPVQLFEHMLGSQFRTNHTAQQLHVKKYCLLPSSAFLSTLDTAPFASEAGLKISLGDWLLFKVLKDKLVNVIKAVGTLGGRKKKTAAETINDEE